MAINKNHEFEDLEGVKCAIVEKNVPQSRVEFLKVLLENNGFTVIVTASPAPKAAPAAKPVAAAVEAEQPAPVAATETPASPPPPATFTVGVTDVRFNAINAVFGRLLRTPDGHTVTLAYWQQKDAVSNDDVPYYEKGL